MGDYFFLAARAKDRRPRGTLESRQRAKLTGSFRAPRLQSFEKPSK